MQETFEGLQLLAELYSGWVIMKMRKQYQGMAEYIIVFVFVVMALVAADLFLFGFMSSGQDEKKTFAGSLIQLHDHIVSVISAPIP